MTMSAQLQLVRAGVSGRERLHRGYVVQDFANGHRPDK
jgi:hypothetical protein